MANYKVVDADKLDADLAQVADAVRSKSGKAEALTFPSGFISSVQAISTGVDTSSDTVTSDTLSEGFTAHNADGDRITGTMKYRIFEGEIVSTVIGSDVYAVLCKDNIIAEHFNDTNLWIKVTFDVEPQAYTVKETWGFNSAGTFSPIEKIGQQVYRYGSGGNFTEGSSSSAIKDNPGTAVGHIRITEAGEVLIYSMSANYAIRPSKYTMEVHWNV